MSIYVYDQHATDFECMGLCGALMPTSCVHDERAGGMSELTLEHPLDPAGKFKCLNPGAIVRALVPVRTTPEITAEGRLVTSVEVYRTTLATKAQRTLLSKPKTGKKLRVLPPGLEVTVVLKQGDWMKLKAGAYGSGWLHRDALELVVQKTLPEDAAAIEAQEPSARVRPQLFRIHEVERTESGVLARARHISYDLLGNLTSYKAETASAPEALRGIMEGCLQAHEFSARTDIADVRHEISYERVNPIKALLDPETGMLSRLRAQLVRDDFELFLLNRAGQRTGVVIEYQKNLLALNCEVSLDSVVTGVLPVGEDQQGGALFLEGEPVLMSSHAAEVPVPRIQVLQVDDAKVSKSVPIALARARMRQAAERLFEAGCDLPTVCLGVDFVLLGDTQEYAQYRDLERLFLYDTLTVRHHGLGLDLSAQVVRTRFDCLNERYISVELGSSPGELMTGTISSWQLPSGISGGKILPGSITGGALSDEVISARHVQAGSIAAGHIQADSISAQHIQADTFSAQKIVAAVSELVRANILKAEIGEATIDWAKVADLNVLIAQVAQAQINHAAIAEAHIQWAEIAELSAVIASIAKAQLTTANISQAQINWAQIASLQAAVAQIAQAEIGQMRVNYASIVDLVSGSAIITEGEAGKLHINRLAVTEANMVSLTVGELVVKGRDGQFYSLVADADGQVRVERKYVGAEDISDQSLPGSKLIESSITARELDVGEIFASEAMVGRVKAAHIDVSDLFASAASFGKVTTNHISADVGANLDLRSNQSIRAMTQTDYLMVDGQGVTIGKSDPDSHFKVNIQADAVYVLQDGVPIAYFRGNKLHAFEAEVAQTISMGRWNFEVDTDGGLSIYRT